MTMPRPFVVLALALVLSGAWAAVAAPAPAAVPCPEENGLRRCPDLVVDPAALSPHPPETEWFPDWHCAVQEGLVAAGERRLVRFTFTSPNLGAGDLRIGAPSDHPEWFTASTCHGHYHFASYAAYRLWTPDAYARWVALRAANLGRPASELLAENPELTFASGFKLGFCAMDSFNLVPGQARRYHCGYQGISAGWADRYDWTLDGQWVDVTGLPEGYYVLEAEVNPERLFEESAVDNNAAARVFWLYGE